MKSVDVKSAFQQAPINLMQKDRNYLMEHKQESSTKKEINLGGLKDAMAEKKDAVQKDKNKLAFMETDNGKDAVAEGVISLWKITSTGQLTKDKEISFNYNQNFIPTKDKRMMLTLSHDSKIVSLGV